MITHWTPNIRKKGKSKKKKRRHSERRPRGRCQSIWPMTNMLSHVDSSVAHKRCLIEPSWHWISLINDKLIMQIAVKLLNCLS